MYICIINMYDIHIYIHIDRQIDRRTDRQTDKQTDREIDRQIDRQKDRQTDSKLICDNQNLNNLIFHGITPLTDVIING